MRAVVKEARVILADGPAGSLDEAAGEGVQGNFIRMLKRHGFLPPHRSSHRDRE